MGKSKKQKKLKPALKIPQAFHVGGQLWKVDYKWRLTDAAGTPTQGLVDTTTNTITMDRLIPIEDKTPVFMELLMTALISQKVVLNEATLAASKDLSAFILDTFNLRWKRKNAN